MRFVFGECECDTERYELRRAGQVVALEPMAFRVLAHLLRQHGRAVAKQELLQACWPGTADDHYTEYSLRNCLHKIRQAVGDVGTRQAVIETVRRYGYRFVAPVQELAARDVLSSDASGAAAELSRGRIAARCPPAPAQPEPPSALPAVPVTPSGVGPAVPSTLEAERRQLTVIVCRLAGLPERAVPPDPEALLEVLPAYHRLCAEVVRRFAGHMAQDQGESLVVYFGYPQAHEDDACRAVYTGLEIVEALCQFQARRIHGRGGRFAVRVGIHTGLVVVRAQGHGEAWGSLALGQTPTIAAQVQGLAPPDTVAISSATLRLVEGYVVSQVLGTYLLDETTEPLVVSRVLQQRPVPSRFAVTAAKGLTPFVGREAELALLHQRWAQVQDGLGQMIVLSGEPGIGKSRLVQVLKDQVVQTPHVLWECHSSPYYQQTPLFPLTEFLPRVLEWLPDDSPAEKVAKLEHTLQQYRLPLQDTVPLFAALLSLPLPERDYPPLTLSPQRQRHKTLESLVAILLELAAHQPVLFILEDLHWTDPTTLEWLELLLEQLPTAAIGAVVTCRAEFQLPWRSRSILTQLTLSRFSRAESTAMLTQAMHGKALPPEVVTYVVAKTDGVPLFVEEMLTMLLESDRLREERELYVLTGPLPHAAIPATLQDLLRARLDRLAEAQDVVQLGAALGREFTYEVLQGVSSLEASTLQQRLAHLIEVEILYQHGVPPQVTYRFKHALIQEVAYTSLLRSTRQQLHARIATALDAQFPELVETQPELVAHHYTEAGLNEQAIGYWRQAGEYAVQRSAHIEAVGHLTKGLETLKALPDTPERTQQELTMCITLGGALLATKGYAAPEVECVYTRALELCQRTGNPPQLSSALFGLWRYYIVRAAYQNAHALAAQLLGLAQSSHDTPVFVLAHYTLGWTCFNLGEITRARVHLEESTALYTPRQRHTAAFRSGQDPGVACLAFATLALWLLGYPDRARSRSHEAVRLSQELAHPFSMAFALIWAAAIPHQLCRAALQAHEQAKTAVTFSAEQGFALLEAWGTILQGWALAIQGQSEEGIAQMHQGLAAHRTMGSEALLPYFLALLAETHAQVGRIGQGLHLVAEALAVTDDHEERFYAAEIHRLQGALLLQQSSDNQSEAESCFHQAITIAQSQSAKSWELRAAMSLARLWQSQGKRQEAYDLLAPVYGWFTEGFDTADLQDAKRLLEEGQYV